MAENVSQLGKCFKPVGSLEEIYVLAGDIDPEGKSQRKWNFARKIRSSLAAPKPLQTIQKIVKRVARLPKKRHSVVDKNSNANVENIKSLVDVLPNTEFDKIDIGAKILLNMFAESTQEQKTKFFVDLIDYIAIMLNCGPDLEDTDLDNIALASGGERKFNNNDSSDDDQEDYEEQEYESNEPNVDGKKVLRFAKALVDLDEIQLYSQQLVSQYEEYHEERHAVFSEALKRKIEKKLPLLTSAVNYFAEPLYNCYGVEAYRTQMRSFETRKLRKHFPVAVYNHFKDMMMEQPVTEKLLAMDYKFCMVWSRLWLRMKNSLKSAPENERSSNEFMGCVVCDLILQDDADAVVVDCCNHHFCNACVKVPIRDRKKSYKAQCPRCKKYFRTWMEKLTYLSILKKLKDSGVLEKPIPNQLLPAEDSGDEDY